jgi:hypothetical protein
VRSPTGGRGDRFVDNATTISGVDISSANGAYVPAAQCEMLLGADLFVRNPAGDLPFRKPGKGR